MTAAAQRAPRPLWMTGMALFCAGTVLFLLWYDLATDSRDVEVWLGFELRGRAARLTAPLHWAIFAAGAWAFWTRQRWIALATALYIAYVAVSHLIWSEVSPNGNGWPIGLLQMLGIGVFAIPFWIHHRRSRAR
jgi:drug/metabolite transporter (DMT)-like permease